MAYTQNTASFYRNTVAALAAATALAFGGPKDAHAQSIDDKCAYVAQQMKEKVGNVEVYVGVGVTNPRTGEWRNIGETQNTPSSPHILYKIQSPSDVDALASIMKDEKTCGGFYAAWEKRFPQRNPVVQGKRSEAEIESEFAQKYVRINSGPYNKIASKAVVVRAGAETNDLNPATWPEDHNYTRKHHSIQIVDKTKQ
jgi:hypothetical protein